MEISKIVDALIVVVLVVLVVLTSVVAYKLREFSMDNMATLYGTSGDDFKTYTETLLDVRKYVVAIAVLVVVYFLMLALMIKLSASKRGESGAGSWAMLLPAIFFAVIVIVWGVLVYKKIGLVADATTYGDLAFTTSLYDGSVILAIVAAVFALLHAAALFMGVYSEKKAGAAEKKPLRA